MTTAVATQKKLPFFVPLVDENGHVCVPRADLLAIILGFTGLAAFGIDGFLPDGVTIFGLPVPHGGFIYLWFCALLITMVTVTLRPPFSRLTYFVALGFIILAMFLVAVYYLRGPNVTGVLHDFAVALVTFVENLPLYFVINALIVGYFVVENILRWFGFEPALGFSSELSEDQLPRLPALVGGDLFLTFALTLVLSILANGLAGVALAAPINVPFTRCVIPVGGCPRVDDLNSLHSVAYLDLLLAGICGVISLLFLFPLMLRIGVDDDARELNPRGKAIAEVVMAAIGASMQNRTLLGILGSLLKRFNYAVWPFLLMGSVGLLAITGNHIGLYLAQVKAAPGCHTLLTGINLFTDGHMPWIYSCQDVGNATVAGLSLEGVALAAGLGGTVAGLLALFLLVDSGQMIRNILQFVGLMLFIAAVAFCAPTLILSLVNGVGNLVWRDLAWPFPQPDLLTVLSLVLLVRYFRRDRSKTKGA